MIRRAHYDVTCVSLEKGNEKKNTHGGGKCDRKVEVGARRGRILQPCSTYPRSVMEEAWSWPDEK